MRYLRKTGAKTVAVVGASMGGDATEDALGLATPGEIDRVVLLAHSAYGLPRKLIGRKLFIVTRDDANDAGLRLPKIRRQYSDLRSRKSWSSSTAPRTLSSCSARIRGERLMREILRLRRGDTRPSLGRRPARTEALVDVGAHAPVGQRFACDARIERRGKLKSSKVNNQGTPMSYYRTPEHRLSFLKIHMQRN